ncbi:MAG: hypothetical protein KDA63_09430, partial [Planctomycetales bacterium]|nr:hypothetical protein [Planctomycetales bacterium]
MSIVPLPGGLNRRECLAALAAAGVALPLSRFARAADDKERLKVAAVITEFTYRSHAHVILENFLEPYLFNGQPTESGMDVVSMYVDQFPEGDMARDVAKRYGFTIYPTIAEALTAGGSDLAVDAVLSIGEHGHYPVNDHWQMEYPRKRFFDEIAAVLEASGRSVPIFSDKHLSYRWDWAREMYDTSRRIGAPLMAGSSVPLAQRFPVMEIPSGAKLTDAVSIHGGGVESYDIHGLEVLQSIVESRAGGETGVASVQFLEGDALWDAAEAGVWSPELADAAMSAELGPGQPPLRRLVDAAIVNPTPPHAIIVTYRDGFRATMLTVGSSGTRWNFACRVEGEAQPRFCRFYVGPWQNRNLFKALSHAIQTHF